MAFWIVWFIIGVCFLIAFTAMVLPRIMLKTHAAMLPVRDKAIEKFSDEHGAVLVYAPAVSVRRYIKSYRIGHDEEGVYFRGEWAGLLAYADYELTIYNADSEVIEILRVKEKFNGEKQTHDTRLPKGADYVTVRILCVDDTPIPAERRKFNLRYAVWLAVLCFCLVLTVDLMLWMTLTFTLRCLDGFTMVREFPTEQWAMLLGYTALGIVFMTCAISLGDFFLMRQRGDVYES